MEQRWTPEVTLACAVLARTLEDLGTREYGLGAAKFLGQQWSHSWDYFLPSLRPSRLRELVSEALGPRHADVLGRGYHPPTKSQRATQRLLLAPLLSGGGHRQPGRVALDGLQEEPGSRSPRHPRGIPSVSANMTKRMVGWDGIEPPTPGFPDLGLSSCKCA
jgi:hypothetical protein